jgi:hypothetical protein
MDEDSSAALEATIFSGWIYDHLSPHAAALKVAHPLMLRAIAAAKKKNDRIDAHKIADRLRCDFLPESYMASTEIRERRNGSSFRQDRERFGAVARRESFCPLDTDLSWKPGFRNVAIPPIPS